MFIWRNLPPANVVACFRYLLAKRTDLGKETKISSPQTRFVAAPSEKPAAESLEKG